MTDEFLTITQLAACLGVRERVISRYVEAGRIPFRKIGKAVRFRWRDIEAWWEALPGSNAIKANPAPRPDSLSKSTGVETAPIPLVRGPRRHHAVPQVREQAR